MIEIKDGLIAKLEDAKARYVAAEARYEEIRQEARRVAEAIDAEIVLLVVLIEKFDEHTKDNTRAFRAVPPASGPIQNGPPRPAEVFPPAAVISCSRCGEQLTQHGNSWVDGTGFGTCGEDNVRHHAVSSNGGRVDQQPTSVRLPAEMVPPLPVAWQSMIGQQVTVTDKEGTLTGRLTGVTVDVVTVWTEQGSTGVPFVNVIDIFPAPPVPPGPTASDPSGAHPAADLSATRPDEPKDGAS